MSLCNECGIPIDPGHRVCDACGFEPTTEVSFNGCPFCGTKQKPGARFCEECGKQQPSVGRDASAAEAERLPVHVGTGRVQSEEQRILAENEARLLEEVRLRRETEARQRAEEQARALADQARVRQAAEARKRAEVEVRVIAEQERVRREAEARERAEEEARVIAEQERERREAEAQQREEEQAREVVEQERVRQEAEARERDVEEARALAEQQRIQQESESRQRAEAEACATADEGVVVGRESAQPAEGDLSRDESTGGSTSQARPAHAILENEPQPLIPPIDEPTESERTEIPEMQPASVDTGVVPSAYRPAWNSTVPVATPRKRAPWVIAGVGVIALGIVLAVVTLTRREPEPISITPKQPSLPVAPKGMVYIPGGEFLMGNDGGDEYAKPAHKVSVNAFFMDANEVTCEEYQKFIQAKDHKTPPSWNDGSYPPGASRQPVTGVDWNDASAYAQWANKRLPTEEEWEFAARGTTGAVYPWGNDWKSGVANAHGARKGLADVASYRNASPFGLFDMVGNAWEWTSTSIHSYPGGAIPEDKLTQAEREKIKVLRGGCYLTNNLEATTTYRSGWPTSGSKYDQTGFRCAQDVPR